MRPVLLAALALGAVAVPATAAPTADAGRAARATLALSGGIGVEVSVIDGVTQTVAVRVEQCDALGCTTLGEYADELGPGELVTSADEAVLTTRFAGHPLKVRWTATDRGLELSSTYIGGGDLGAETTPVVAGRIADVSATVLGLRCSGEGSLGLGGQVNTYDEKAPSLPAHEPAWAADLTC